MKLTEAVNNYYKNGDKTALYEAVVNSGLKYTEKVEVLKDTMKEDFDSMELSKTIYREKIKKGKVTEKYYFAN